MLTLGQIPFVCRELREIRAEVLVMLVTAAP